MFDISTLCMIFLGIWCLTIIIVSAKQEKKHLDRELKLDKENITQHYEYVKERSLLKARIEELEGIIERLQAKIKELYKPYSRYVISCPQCRETYTLAFDELYKGGLGECTCYKCGHKYKQAENVHNMIYPTSLKEDEE